MAGILGRSQFLSEAANLFTDEKTASARSRVVEWVNELATTTSPDTKCEIIVKIQETILGSCMELLEEFLESILSLAHNSNMEVRKQVINFMEQICKLKVESLPDVISTISMLLRDRSPQVIKRAIQACGSIYKNGLQWICSHNELTDSVEQTWTILSLVKAQILDLIDNDNDGIRTNAIKFLEGVVILQSYADEDSQKKDNDFSLSDIPEHLKILKRKKLEEEAYNIFDILLQFHGATHISSVNLIACTGSLCSIAKLRPSFMAAVVEAFKNLNSNLPPTLTDSQVSSVRKSLKMQILALLKQKGSFEFQAILKSLLSDLGMSTNEIQRNTPKMDKQEQTRRQKRILENATNNSSKRMRITQERTIEANESYSKIDKTVVDLESVDMDVDNLELEKQKQKSARINEKFIAEHIRHINSVVNLVMQFLPNLPDKISDDFEQNYKPSNDFSVTEMINKISSILGEQMSDQHIGPGVSVSSSEKKNLKVNRKPLEKSISRENIEDNQDDEQLRKNQATKKLRENMERVRSEQDLIERMKQRVKTLKLQEVTKPFPRAVKEMFLLESVKRILYAEKQCLVGGVSAKRRKILSVIAATFPDNVRYFILEFILQDIRHRVDLAFSWLFEEYCLLQGFTRHSYVKSENRPDYAYNELISQLIEGINNKCEVKDKIVLQKRIFLEAPLIPECAIKILTEMCLREDFVQYSLDLIKDLILLKPPRRNKFLRILLSFSVHDQTKLREVAVDTLITIYIDHQLLTNRIDEFALEWLCYLEEKNPPANIFSKEYGRLEIESSWREDIIKICLALSLNLLPYNAEVYLNKICKIYVTSIPELKRTILRSIDIYIKKLGPEHPMLLKLIDECPKGTETLIIRVIYILSDKEPVLNVQFVKHVRDLYTKKLKDVRVLIPVLAGLNRTEIIAALPKLIKLNQIVVREIFNRLLNIGPDFKKQTLPTSPADILVALHNIDVNTCDLKCVVKATSLCLSEKDIYTQDVLTIVLRQLVDMVPLPTLLMRTIIQSLTIYPRLASFVISLLQRLILKQVWRYKVIWEGFLKCCQRLKPQSLPVLIQLPLPQLHSALQQCPELRDPLQEYVESIKDDTMHEIHSQVLDVISGKNVDVFVADESGGYITIENIKQETEELYESNRNASIEIPLQKPPTFVKSVQPLPPGEE